MHVVVYVCTHAFRSLAYMRSSWSMHSCMGACICTCEYMWKERVRAIAGLLGPQDLVCCCNARQIYSVVQCTRVCTSQRLQKKHARQSERFHRLVCVSSSSAHAREHIRGHVYTDRMGACTCTCMRAVRRHSESMHACMPVHDRDHARVHACAHQKTSMHVPFCSCTCMRACTR
jgi:hypothetical protein